MRDYGKKESRGEYRAHEKEMSSPTMPKKEWEEKNSQIEVANLKYAGEFSNPRDLQKSADDLAKFARDKRMKY